MTTSDFIPGQRFISDTEPELGLGTVEQQDFRTITVKFPANDESRMYSREQAPLTRVRFSQHDVIENTHKQKLTVHEVTEEAGLLTYIGEDENGETIQFSELELNPAMKLDKPRDRLFNAQFDKNNTYSLRYETLQRLNTLLPSPVRGLCGPRISPVPHQFFIAHEVSRRSAPRVLLADEVGLGKTIEAGLILHQQLIQGRAQRVLILVPETLQHQWLVEMLRRFNLHFSVYNEQRCASLDEETDNPFLAEQLILCSIEFLAQSEKRSAQVIEGQWDTLVVDEAHHLQWRPEASSVEYDLVEKLSRTAAGVLLLTATPEQLGAAGHFARLRLLDPDRFYDFEEFLQEEALYEPVANAVDTLQQLKPLTEKEQQALELALADSHEGKALLNQLMDASNEDRAQLSEQLITLLRDRHGTGRILFRNTRNTIKGFPHRELISYPLKAPDEYLQPILETGRQAETHADIARFALTPERIYQTYKSDASVEWTELDPRVDWLYQQLKALGKHKVLVICASANTVLDLEKTLRTRYGLHAAVFHEAMSIVERDRAAAYFADPVEGSQVLICSEIGSEGRNFQFAHHLFLFDLPLNPDLLEQRIGRLDRIGQQHSIQIMVPFIEHSAQEVMLNWYHQGINAFEQTCPAGLSVY
ncbi:MAG: RNA polymerase-associated protein RapA, partial [Gammaproteobacteria bacterium]|nr:RNA polymerase-associated protein RapA [Gammaproteobacteria bacterium]